MGQAKADVALGIEVSCEFRDGYTLVSVLLLTETRTVELTWSNIGAGRHDLKAIRVTRMQWSASALYQPCNPVGASSNSPGYA